MKLRNFVRVSLPYQGLMSFTRTNFRGTEPEWGVTRTLTISWTPSPAGVTESSCTSPLVEDQLMRSWLVSTV